MFDTYYEIAILSGLVALFVGLIAVYFSHHLAEFTNLTDDPDLVRKFHEKSTPTSGGIGIGVGYLAGFITFVITGSEFITDPLQLFFVYFSIGAAVIFATGLYDDIFGLSSQPKFLLQGVAALIIIYGFDTQLISTHASYADLGVAPKTVLYALIGLWLVSGCNTINLIDGVDGLAGSITITILFGLGVISLSWNVLEAGVFIYPMAGAILAFLYFNRPPASIFMGDTGSLLIGFSLSTAIIVMGLYAAHWMYSLSLIILFGVPLLDTVLSIIRRVRDQKNPFESDSNHIHHLIQRHYKSPYMAIVILSTVSLLLVLLGILLANTTSSVLFFTVFGITMCLFLIVAITYTIQLRKQGSIIHENLKLPVLSPGEPGLRSVRDLDTVQSEQMPHSKKKFSSVSKN